MVERGDALVLCKRMARRRKRAAAVLDLVELILRSQLVVGVLSHPCREHLCCMTVMSSRTMNCRTAPASSRSEFVREPLGFVVETKVVRMCSGHKTRHTVGWSVSVPPKRTPPAPSPEASCIPMKFGSLMTSCLALMRLEAVIRKRCFQSRTDWIRSLLRVVHLDVLSMSLSNGAISAFPAGMPMHACRSFPLSDSISFVCILCARFVLLSMVMIFVTLSFGSCSSRCSPSNSHPSISFSMSHLPSVSIFFWLMLSGPWWLVYEGGGKTEWTACRAALE